ncbi:MAG: DUF3095 family protein [Nonlabens sp.]
MQDNSSFYSELKVNYLPVQSLIRESRLFSAAPEDWVVFIADVVDSTNAVNSGKHQNVNLAATGCVVAVMNALGTNIQNCQIPYFFGGDGATFIVPGKYSKTVNDALQKYSARVFKNLQLTLRTGKMNVGDIYDNDYEINVAKVRLNKYLTIPLVLGNGLLYAEDQIKARFRESEIENTSDESLDLNGMECRWDQISPRDDRHKVVCLIVSCKDESLHPTVYGDILDMIDLTFGTLQERQPITVARLKLKATIQKIREEMMARIGENKLSYLIKHFVITYFGTLYFKLFKEGQNYLNKVSQLSDTLMMDGSLNTVMEGSSTQIEMLGNYLDLLEKEGKIKYGMHATYASVMSCYVQDRGNNHIHFVDGTEGGYTSAAIIYKAKYKKN